MKNRRTHSYLNIFSLALAHLALLVLLMALMTPAAQAGPLLSDSPAGRRVMVNYILHFAHHVQWPIEVFTGTDAPFRICVMGGDQLRDTLAERLAHHRVAGRRVALERVNQGELTRARSCQIMVMGEMKRATLLKAVGELEFFPVLTVSDAERFAATGGIVGFTGTGDNVALQLNKTMLDRAELKMGDSLFRVSRKLQ
ncbi:YfiR family protein [Microbulbifer hainanensis]|uniref:YfiR family protein n=1 Tax=Microbulbifer hainanensis TaxID=2735675 RepID=UPI001D032112|nr:YfiR family protein [Microbulbifer hainanensis]